MTARRLTHRPTHLRLKAPHPALLAALVLLAGLLAGLYALRSRAAALADVPIASGTVVLVGSQFPAGFPAGEDARVPAGEPPRAELPAHFYDFGAIPATAVVQRDFLIVNRGAGPLVILSAYTTCGCTTAELSTASIPPGQAARATVTFDAGYHPLAGQTVRRGLVLETNDPDRPVLEIWVQAEIEK